MNPLFTQVRTQGSLAARTYVRPPATNPGPAGRDAKASFLEHDCPSCGASLRDDEDLAAFPLGPGPNAEARTAQRRGEGFDAVGVVVHERCAGKVPDLTPAVKVSAAAWTIRDAAIEAAKKAAHHRLTDIQDPSPALFRIADDIEGAGNDLSGWEEQFA